VDYVERYPIKDLVDTRSISSVKRFDGNVKQKEKRGRKEKGKETRTAKP